MMKYNRILLKLSGEALLGKNSYGIDNDRLVVYAEEIKEIHKQGVEIAIVPLSCSPWRTSEYKRLAQSMACE